jgi:hypothetical protein
MCEKPFAMTTPAEVEVLAADINAPFGYLIVLRSGRLTIDLHPAMSENWSPYWLLGTRLAPLDHC